MRKIISPLVRDRRRRLLLVARSIGLRERTMAGKKLRENG
jgi:hypothetical protein